MAHTLRDQLISTDAEIAKITGERFYEYTSAPGDGQTRVVFADGTVRQGYRAGLAYAELMLAHVRVEGAHAGWKFALRDGK